MEEYLLRTRPSTRIIGHLYDEQATRMALIKAIRDIGSDDLIQKGDPILIYYAGHGATVPAGTSDSGKVEALVPYDCSADIVSGGENPKISAEDGQRAHSASQGAIRAIPDYTFNNLLRIIADQKEDNITVILDCCHSGSATREIQPAAPNCMARGIEFKDALPVDLDADIPKATADRAIGRHLGFLHAGLSSHVLLAACGKEEQAWEDDGRGAFTKELLRLLEELDRGMTQVSYTDLIGRMLKLPRKQYPQCEGMKKDRKLFHSLAPIPGRSVMHHVYREGDEYKVKAGTAHGIAPGSEFSLYASPSSKDAPVGTFIASSTVSLFSTVIRPSTKDPAPNPGLQSPLFALQTLAGEEAALQLHVSQNAEPLLAKHVKQQHLFQRVRKDKADASIFLDDGKAVLHIYATAPRMKRVAKRVPIPEAADIEDVLQKVAHYYWHLRRSPRRDIIGPSLRDDVTVELVRLRQEGMVIEPDPSSPSIKAIHGRIDIDIGSSSPNTPYGIKVTCKGDPLYVSLFYFNSGELEINSTYQGNAGEHPDHDLSPERPLIIGYGPGNAAAGPLVFELPFRQDLDVSFVKLFLSSQPVNLSSLPQLSPFSFDTPPPPPTDLPPQISSSPSSAIAPFRRGVERLQRGAQDVLGMVPRAIKLYTPEHRSKASPLPPSWDTVTIAIVQKTSHRLVAMIAKSLINYFFSRA
ncbi:hypothetical protein OF83DRAFT_1150129 [Amylostereum chailletii]|nr:hypothetical protein OF83DRAFT_1150129 [Amylostereum chailletii]